MKKIEKMTNMQLAWIGIMQNFYMTVRIGLGRGFCCSVKNGFFTTVRNGLKVLLLFVAIHYEILHDYAKVPMLVKIGWSSCEIMFLVSSSRFFKLEGFIRPMGGYQVST